MSIPTYSNQKIAVNHGFVVRSEELQYMNKDIWSLGVIKGLEVTRVDATHVNIAPGVVVLKDYTGNHPDIVVKIELTAAISSLAVDNTDGTHYVVVKYDYTLTDNPTATFFDTTAAPTATTNYIKLAEYVAASGDITVTANSRYYANVLDDGAQNMTIQGNTVLNGNLNVGIGLTVTDDIHANSKLMVTDYAGFSSNIGISGNINVHGSIINGNTGTVVVDDNLNVTGTTTLSGALSVNGRTTLSDVFVVNSNSYLNIPDNIAGEFQLQKAGTTIIQYTALGNIVEFNRPLRYNISSDNEVVIEKYVYSSSNRPNITFKNSSDYYGNLFLTSSGLYFKGSDDTLTQIAPL